MPQLSLHTPIGDITVSAENDVLVAVDWGWGRDQTETPLLGDAKAQLEAYFDGELREFSLPLAPTGGNRLQQQVWAEMLRIPYGETRTYGALASRLRASARAIGTACGRNPLPILIPCHRVVGASGLGGYSGQGGRETKTALLRLEGALHDEQIALPF